MIMPIELRFKADKDSKSVFQTGKTIKSHDVKSVEFHITIEGLELTDSHTAKILSVFHQSKSQANADCEIVEGKIIYKPDTNLISMYEHVTNYVYVYHNNHSLDVREFIYTVDLSKIDETSLEVKEVYDQSYADLLADFELALEDYKESLPQASELRVEIDEVLDNFKADSRAKLNVIEAAEEIRQTAENTRQERFESKETARQEIFNQAESSRQEAEAERVEAEVVRRTTFDTNETARQAAYITAENARGQSYSVAESSRDDIFQEAEINRSQQTTVANLKDGSYLKYWAGSQVEYDAIGTYDLDTIYDIWG